MKKYYEEHPSHDTIKNFDYVDIDGLEVACPDEIIFSSEETPLIGTYNLREGICIIISNGENEHVLGHLTQDIDYSVYIMLNKISATKPLKVTVIPGTTALSTKVESLLTFLQNKNNIQLYNFIVEVKNLQRYDDNNNGIEFALDTRTEEYLKPDFASLLSGRRV